MKRAHSNRSAVPALIGTGAYSETKPLLMLAFCTYVIAWFLQVSYRIEPLGKLRFELLLGAILAVIAISSRKSLKDRRVIVDERGMVTATIILVVLIAIQVPLSFNIELSWKVFVDRVFKFGFMAIFIAAFVRSPRDLRWFLAAFLLGCGFVTQESFRGALSGNMIWENQGVPRLHGDTPMFQHPNSLAGLATGVLPFVVYLFPYVKKLWLRGAVLLVGATALGCILYSGSRTSYLGVLGFLAFFLLTSRHRIKVAVLLFGVLLPIGWTMMPDIYRARFETIFTGQEIQGNSMGARKEIMHDALIIFAEHPLGVGVSAFPTVREQRFGRTQDTHNLYLEVATNIGIQGFIAFLVFVSLLLRRLLAVRRRCDQEIARLDAADAAGPPGQGIDRLREMRRQHRVDLGIMGSTALAVAGYIFVRLVLGMFGMDLYEIYWWISLGCAVALCRMLSHAVPITDRLVAAEQPASAKNL